jgi:D-glycero-alpha-D-manno-heptose 1-phosphate guanylyltransferase
MKPILVLAGGFGSRLKSVVSHVPKPLAPVCGKPFLIYLIEHLVSQGGREFVFLLHYEAVLVQSMLADFSGCKTMDGVTIRSIVEGIPLGTGGSIMNAINALKIDKSFLVVNADTWLGDGLKQLDLSPASSMAAIKVKDCSRYGTLAVEERKVKVFLEKEPSSKSGLINAGLYHLSPTIFREFVGNDNFSLEDDVFPKLADNGNLFVTEIETDFIDIGIPKDYRRFCRWIESGKKIEL